MDLNLALLQHGRVKRVQAVAAAEGGWPVRDPVLRIAEFRSRRLCLVCPRASSGCDAQTDGDVDWSVAGGWCSPSASL